MSDLSGGSGTGGLTAVIDIGKTSSRLLLVDDVGQVTFEAQQSSGSVPCSLGYQALDTLGCESWLRATLAGLGTQARALRRIIVTTHGAAVAALRGEGLALPIPDYESIVFDDREPGFELALDHFDDTLAPLLPRGLNVGMQLDWLERHAQAQLDAADTLLPYAQYWAWWLTGVRASEVSSLGCHTLLWRPQEQRFSDWAHQRGWAARFAPLRKAWEVLGSLRASLARELGLPEDVQVHVGAHDSNACLARYLRAWPRMSLISTGTWVVAMAPGAISRGLRAQVDQLANVSVRGDMVPTARFMGGRELAHLCAGADPGQAQPSRIAGLLQRGLRILPGFSSQGGAFSQQTGRIELRHQAVSMAEWQRTFDACDRATAASIYLAYMTAWTLKALGSVSPIVIDGPAAHNAVTTQVLAALLPAADLYVSKDPIEGTGRGAWILSRWTSTTTFEPQVDRIECPENLGQLLRDEWGTWCNALPAIDGSSSA